LGATLRSPSASKGRERPRHPPRAQSARLAELRLCRRAKKCARVDASVRSDWLDVCVNDALAIANQRDHNSDRQELCIGAVVPFQLVHGPLGGGAQLRGFSSEVLHDCSLLLSGPHLSPPASSGEGLSRHSLSGRALRRLRDWVPPRRAADLVSGPVRRAAKRGRMGSGRSPFRSTLLESRTARPYCLRKDAHQG
jgi:hypothetical protein